MDDEVVIFSDEKSAGFQSRKNERESRKNKRESRNNG